MSAALGQRVNQDSLDKAFLSSPGDDLVDKLIAQISSVPQMNALFGPYKKGHDQQRWADYQRMDWSIRQLPCLSVFESQSEQKESDNAWLSGSITIQAYWPPNLRRSDLSRVPGTFKGILENFFASKYCTDMLDELYYVTRPMKVFALNELGKQMTWTTNVEGIVESQMVPVTMVDVRYRIDLRAWYRAMELMGRTKQSPFESTLSDLTRFQGVYDGVKDDEAQQVEIEIVDGINVTNP